MSELQEQLKKRRINKNMKQEDIAKILNISRTTYTHWENGRYEPDIKQLIKIADFYEISLDHLVGRYNKN